MKKMLAFCMAAVMSLALLSGCMSADPDNPYEVTEEEETAAVLVVEI